MTPNPSPVKLQKEYEQMARLQQERGRERVERSINYDVVPENNSGFSDEQISKARIKVPEKSPFPVFMLSLAVFKDWLDVPQLTIIGIILSWIATALFTITAFVWCLGKFGFTTKFIIKRIAGMVAVALVPIVGLLPEASVFILWAHYREGKYIGKMLQTLETMEGAEHKK